jgi:uncharacterized iron-regulated protein/poly(3-hydroxybutyrate) depolymerase
MGRDLLVIWNVPFFVALRFFLIAILTMAGTGLAAQEGERWRFAKLVDSISIRDGHSHERLDWDELIKQLADVDVVFLGETHDDDATHELQLAVYRELLERRNGAVVLAMEMFERDVQPQLNAYLAGEIDEATFLQQARPWGNYHEGYRPLVELARQYGKPVVASNFPRPLRMKLMQAGEQGLDGLGNDRNLAPAELLPNSDLYWKRTDNATRGHSAFMPAATSPSERLLSTQSLWDNSMGEACVLALRDNPGYSVVHLNGGFHSEYWDGTVGQVRQRLPGASIKTVAIRPATNPSTAEIKGAPVADFVVMVDNRAKNLRDGVHNVIVSNERPFRLHVPKWATADRPAPLLIWLADDGLTTEDGLEWWKLVLGDEAAIAVLQPTHLQRERDMTIGGRWFWPDHFSEDTGATVQAIERLWQYTLSRFPVDKSRVVLAGEGTGATMASAATLLTSKMDIQTKAWNPRQYVKLKDFPLPLLENWGDTTPPKRSLTVYGGTDHEKWWREELKEYATVGLESEWRTTKEDPWEASLAQSKVLRSALGIQAQNREPSQKRYFLTEYGTPRERHWLRVLAHKNSSDTTQITVVDRRKIDGLTGGNRVQVSSTINPEDVGRIPLCPGAFGGTTVLVLDANQANAELDDWLQLEQSDPLTKRSRFHRLRIAINGPGERGLKAVLEKLLSENRKNVLVVPATFYAGDSVMRTLEEQTESLADSMTIHWLPGLGGEDFPISEAEQSSQELSREQATAVINEVWQGLIADLKTKLDAELKSEEIQAAGKSMKIKSREFGEALDTGRSLFISMHGGGNTSASVNDRQWENQIRLYQPEEGIYVAPRAPTNTWNLWHEGHIDPLFDRLILAHVLCRNVDPNRVYLLGYSAGGDGVYQLAPRMSDRWAAVAMMAGHPNETRSEGLRNVPFSLFMGGQDAAFNRNQIAVDWQKKLKELSTSDPDGYRHWVKIYPEHGHWMKGDDRESLPWMTEFQRMCWPKRVVWVQDDVTHPRLYWLGVPNEQAKAGDQIIAAVNGQTIEISTTVERLTLYLNDELVDLDQPIKVRWNEQEVFSGKLGRSRDAITRSLSERLDRYLAATAILEISASVSEEIQNDK